MVVRKRRLTAWDKEYRDAWQQELQYIRKYAVRKVSVLDRKMGEIAPEKLEETLHAAFIKAFALVFKNGTGVISWVGRRKDRQLSCQIREYKTDLKESRKNLRSFNRAAKTAGMGNVIVSGAAGLGMGLFGATLPDVPLFTAMLLKSVYETAESFGFGHDTPAERRFVLRLIEAALCHGAELEEKNEELNRFMQTGRWQEERAMDMEIRAAARRLSEEVLYGKVLQNIPLVGAVGGAKDGILVSRVQKYAAIKYRRRFLLRRREN